MADTTADGMAGCLVGQRVDNWVAQSVGCLVAWKVAM